MRNSYISNGDGNRLQGLSEDQHPFTMRIAEENTGVISAFDVLLDESKESVTKVERIVPGFIKRTIMGNSFIEFLDHRDAVDYAAKCWKSHWDGLSDDLRDLVLNYEALGRYLSDNKDIDVIDAARKVIMDVPPVEDNLLLFRGGRDVDFEGDRPFLAASFLKSTAECFALNDEAKVYTIVVYKGAKFIPICGIGKLGYIHEEEVLIEVSRLSQKGMIMEYH